MTPASWSPLRSLDPSPAEARKWLSDELHRSDYHNPWLDSALRWIVDQLTKLLDGANKLANGGLSLVVTLLVALVTIALLVWVLPKVRREPVVGHPDGAVIVDPTITAGSYRDLAARALADGRYDAAVLEGFRATAKDMSDRTLLDDAPGLTAHEVSLELSRPFPDFAGRLAQSANLFDAVRYGHRSATKDGAAQVLRLDSELAKARPVLLALPLHVPV
jgi:Domain of unknown function (DUF4129)